jgi:hypothetical protein
MRCVQSRLRFISFGLLKALHEKAERDKAPARLVAAINAAQGEVNSDYIARRRRHQAGYLALRLSIPSNLVRLSLSSGFGGGGRVHDLPPLKKEVIPHFSLTNPVASALGCHAR